MIRETHLSPYCVYLGVEKLLGSPSSIRELYSRLVALAHFHVYAQALSAGFSYWGRAYEMDIVPAVNHILQRLGHVSYPAPAEPDRPIDMGAILKLMLQDQLGLSPVLQHSPMDAQDVKRMESLLLPFLAAHPAVCSDWLLPAPYAFVQLPLKVKRTFLLCSRRAESPVSQLSIELVKRILGFAQCHLRFGLFPPQQQAFRLDVADAAARRDLQLRFPNLTNVDVSEQKLFADDIVALAQEFPLIQRLNLCSGSIFIHGPTRARRFEDEQEREQERRRRKRQGMFCDSRQIPSFLPSSMCASSLLISRSNLCLSRSCSFLA